MAIGTKDFRLGRRILVYCRRVVFVVIAKDDSHHLGGKLVIAVHITFRSLYAPHDRTVNNFIVLRRTCVSLRRLPFRHLNRHSSRVFPVIPEECVLNEIFKIELDIVLQYGIIRSKRNILVNHQHTCRSVISIGPDVTHSETRSRPDSDFEFVFVFFMRIEFYTIKRIERI